MEYERLGRKIVDDTLSMTLATMRLKGRRRQIVWRYSAGGTIYGRLLSGRVFAKKT